MRELDELGGRAEFSWLLSGVNGPIQVNVRSAHAGGDTKVPQEAK